MAATMVINRLLNNWLVRNLLETDISKEADVRSTRHSH